MTPLPILVKLPLVILALSAAFFDWRTRKIPNWLVVAGICAGVAIHWKPALYGMGLALAAQLPFFALRMIGAGDVKLMVAVGAITGPMPWLFLFAISSVLEGPAALIQKKRGHRRLPRGPFVAAAVLLLLLVT